MIPKLHTPSALFAALLATLTALPAAHAVAPVNPPAVYREGEVLVKYRAGVSGAEVQALHGKLGMLAKRSVGHGRTELLQLPRVTTTAAALGVLRADPAVEHAEPNFRRFTRTANAPNDPLFGQQWGLRNTGQPNFSPTGPAGIPGADLNVLEAWDSDANGTADRTGDPSVIVAVIDDAVQTNHPDLAGSMVAGRNFVACQDPADPNPTSSEGAHGTLVAGCIVARANNSLGVAGVAHGSSLMPLKFAFDTATFIQALEYARDNGARIINASFGGPGYSQLEQDTLASLAADDILFVTSAGNDDSNTDLAVLNYPANYDAENIVAVAATNRQDNIASFSQYGPMSVDAAAPGLQIVTTQIPNGYSTSGVSGTSFSSPYVAGVAALLKSHVLPEPGFLETKARLIESGSAVAGANPKLRTSGGRVDADLALDMAARPALVVRGMSFDSANSLPDPGETLNVTFTVRNLWQDATGVTATLAADNGVTVISGAQSPGAILSQGQADVTFQIAVEPAVTEHRYVTFTLSLAADGGYSAVRSIGTELGTLTPGVQITQDFTDSIYDEFHAWHVDVAPGAGSGKTLLIRTTTTGAQDIDLLVKKDVAPQYSITVGINPETEAGFFCTSGTTASCQDPDTLLSARLDGVEEVSVVNPAAGSYRTVVVNFVQSALLYTLEAVLVDGDVRPDSFEFVDQSGAPPGMAESNEVLITGITQPAPITVASGEYSINGGGYTSVSGTISNAQRVRVRTGNTGGFRRTQLTIGGVTETFLVNAPPPPSFGSGDTSCFSGGGGGGGGRVPAPLLAVLLLGALARRCPRAA